MIYRRLESIRTDLDNGTTAFDGGGWIIRDGQEQRINGLTDIARNYFYLDFQETSRQIEFQYPDQGCGGVHMAKANIKLIIMHQDYTFESIMNYAIQSLLTFDARIESITRDASFIFMGETGQDPQDEYRLTRIDFSIEIPYRPFNCEPVQCEPC